MNKEKKGGLLYPLQHLTCNHYVSDHRCYFKYYEISEHGQFPCLDTNNNHLLFLRKGKVTVDGGNFQGMNVATGEMLLLPCFIDVRVTIQADSHFLICSFDVPMAICDKLMLHEVRCLPIDKEIDSSPVKIKYQTELFIDLLVMYLQNQINCEHLHEIKQKEMFLSFKWYYTEEELTFLFHSIAKESYKFRQTVLENYIEVEGVSKMASILNMSLRSFQRAFKKEFGIPYSDWMLKQCQHRILYKAAEPGVTMNTLVEYGNFSSSIVFNHFCRKHFKCTPGELIKNKGIVTQ